MGGVQVSKGIYTVAATGNDKQHLILLPMNSWPNTLILEAASENRRKHGLNECSQTAAPYGPYHQSNARCAKAMVPGMSRFPCFLASARPSKSSSVSPGENKSPCKDWICARVCCPETCIPRLPGCAKGTQHPLKHLSHLQQERLAGIYRVQCSRLSLPSVFCIVNAHDLTVEQVKGCTTEPRQGSARHVALLADMRAALTAAV